MPLPRLRVGLAAAALLLFTPCVHAISLVASTSAQDEAADITVDAPAGLAEGHVLVAQISFRGGSGVSVTPPSGWSPIRRTNGTDLVQIGYYRVAGATEPGIYSWSLSSSQPVTGIIAAYRNVDPDDPIDADSGQSGNGPTVAAPQVTTTVPNTRLLGLFSSAAGNAPFSSPPPAMTARENLNTGAGPNGVRSLLADETLANAGGSGTRAADAGADVAHIGQLVALRPAPAGAPVRVRFFVQPSETTAGQVISPALEVRIEDADGAVVSDSTAAITLGIETDPAGGTLSGTTTVNAVNGVATFADLAIDQVGEGYTLRATGTDLDPDVSDLFDIVPPDQVANAFDPDTPAGEVVGPIGTRVAGAPFALDIVAIDSGTVDQGFDDTVDVRLLDASDNSGDMDDMNCRDSWQPIQDIGTVAFDGTENGRARLNGIQENDAWRRVRVQIERIHPPGQAGVIGCSNDAFAIRPDRFIDVQASDVDPETPGFARTLANASPGGNPVHVAGAPFTIEATAVNAHGDITQNYAGSPDTDVACIAAGVPCVDGALDPGAWTSSSGTVVAGSAVYDEAGAFALTLSDRDFAAVDAGDSTASERFVRSAAVVDVGRFIPDHFLLLNRALTDRVAAACPGTPGFTYAGERFRLEFELVAQTAGDQTTENYAGGWARLDTVAELGFGAVDGSVDLSPGLDVAGPAPDWQAGVLDAVYDVMLERDQPAGPYRDVEIGVRPIDADGVAALSYDVDIDGDGTNTHVLLGETELRFGRLVIENAAGAEIAPIDLPVRAEYWTGSTWDRNDLDDCTTLTLVGAIRLANELDADSPVAGDRPIDIAAGQTRITSGDLTLDGGAAVATFAAPGAGNTGWAEVTGLLSAGAADYGFLQGDPDADNDWSTDPTGRITFGIHGGNDRWIDVRRVPVD